MHFDAVVIPRRGRGLTSLGTYLEIERTGRRAPMGRRQREQVWDLMAAWDAEMVRRETVAGRHFA